MSVVVLDDGDRGGKEVDEADEFRPVPGYEHAYRISRYGVVQTSQTYYGRSLRGKWKTMKFRRKQSGGHHDIGLSKNGRQYRCLVHRLVLQAFGPPMPFPGALALHRDDNPDNNHIDNLYWGTSKNNRADAMRSGRAYIPKGEENGKAILTEAAVAEILATPRVYGYRLMLARKFGVSVAAIKDVFGGRSWTAQSRNVARTESYDKRASRKAYFCERKAAI